MTSPRPTLAELRARVQKDRHREIGNWLACRFARPTAVYGCWLAIRLGLSAHQVTLAALFANLGAAMAIGSGERRFFVLGVVLAYLAFWLDHVDGQVARWRDTASLDGVYFDYLMHHAANLALGFSLGYGLAARSGDVRWTILGFLIATGWTLLSLHNDCRYKAFFQRLKSVNGRFRVDAGRGGRPQPPMPWPRHGRAALTWPAFKACEPHVVLLVLAFLALLAMAVPDVWPWFWRIAVVVWAVLSPGLGIARIARSVVQNKVEDEFSLWFQPIESRETCRDVRSSLPAEDNARNGLSGQPIADRDADWRVVVELQSGFGYLPDRQRDRTTRRDLRRSGPARPCVSIQFTTPPPGLRVPLVVSPRLDLTPVSAKLRAPGDPSSRPTLVLPLMTTSQADHLDHVPELPRGRDVGIGVVGAGFIVRDCHLVAYERAGFRVAGITSRSIEKACEVAALRDVARVYGSLDAMLDDPAVQVVDVAVPPAEQPGVILRLLDRNRHVRGLLAQKPLAMSYGEAKSLVEACARAGVVLQVNQNMRYDHSVRALKTLLNRGLLGEPVLATIELRAIPHWMPWAEGGRSLSTFIMSIHHLDTFRYWLGDPIRVLASTRPDPRTGFPHADGINLYMLEYASGARAAGWDDVWAGPSREGAGSAITVRWRFEGTEGIALGEIGWPGWPEPVPSTIDYTSIRDQGSWQRPRWAESWFPDAFAGTMGGLLRALETGQEPDISGQDNLKTIALCEAVLAGARDHRVVPLDEFAGIDFL